MADEATADVLGLTAKIVSAHIGKTQVAVDLLPSLIKAVYRSLATVGEAEAASVAQTPAVPVKKSVGRDFIVCLEDGKKRKMLKRHLRTRYGMTPDTYRAKWGLSADYPMVAPSHAALRSALARKIGLGRKPAAEPGTPERPARHAKSAGR